jgi:uncharacterized protein (TIGR02453 family)
MAKGFPGFPPAAMTFFRKLAANNDREWFTAHKSDYDTQVKQPMIALIEAINAELSKFAVDHVTDPKKAMYRIHRDTRFSHDKTPYKDHQAAMFGHCRLPKNYCAGLYFSINHKEVEVAGGLYMPEPEQLAAVRQSIVDDAATWKKLVTDKSLTRVLGQLQGQALARPPKGFDPTHEGIAWIQMKQFYFYETLDPKLATTPKLLPEITKRFKLLVPVITHLNRIILTTMESVEDDTPKRPAPMF